MQLPSIHLNGSSADSLAESYQHAASELGTALNALSNVELNGRDYYPQGNDAFKLAVAEHEERIRKLRAIAAEVQIIADHCWTFVK